MTDALAALLLRELKALASTMSPWITTPEMMALGFTDDGLPRHPLMLGYSTPLVEFATPKGGA